MSNRRGNGRHSRRPALGRAGQVTFRARRNLDWRPLLLLGLLSFGEGTAAADEQPSVELLEFLGSWEAKDGDGSDPISLLGELLDDIEPQPQPQQTTQSEGKQND